MLRLRASKIKSPLKECLTDIGLGFIMQEFRQVVLVPRSGHWDHFQVQLSCTGRKAHYRDGTYMLVNAV